MGLPIDTHSDNVTDAAPTPDSATSESDSNSPTAWSIASLQLRYEAFADWGLEWVRVVRRAIPAVDLLWELGARFRSRNGSVLVGFITYRLFLWLVPLGLISTAVIGFSSSIGSVELVTYASELGVATDTVEDLSEQAETGWFAMLMAGLFALAFATRGLIRGLHFSFAQAAGIEITKRVGIVRQVGIVIPAALVACVLLALISLLQHQGPVLALSTWLGSWVLTATLLWGICWIMPRRATRWIDAVPGPLVAAAGLAGVQLFISAYLPGRIQSASALYGSLGVALAILFYMFLIASVLVAMPFVNGIWMDRNMLLDGRPWILDPNALPGWSRRPARWAQKKIRQLSDGDDD